jgi:hypothetical protein
MTCWVGNAHDGIVYEVGPTVRMRFAEGLPSSARSSHRVQLRSGLAGSRALPTVVFGLWFGPVIDAAGWVLR